MIEELNSPRTYKSSTIIPAEKILNWLVESRVLSIALEGTSDQSWQERSVEAKLIVINMKNDNTQKPNHAVNIINEVNSLWDKMTVGIQNESKNIQ